MTGRTTTTSLSLERMEEETEKYHRQTAFSMPPFWPSSSVMASFVSFIKNTQVLSVNTLDSNRDVLSDRQLRQAVNNQAG